MFSMKYCNTKSNHYLGWLYIYFFMNISAVVSEPERSEESLVFGELMTIYNVQSEYEDIKELRKVIIKKPLLKSKRIL